MQVKITFAFKNLVLPFAYNRILQAMVLKWLGDEKYSRFIHEEGFTYGQRKYKLFTFSKLFGEFKIDRKKKLITFFEMADFYIAAHDDKFIEYLANTLLRDDFSFINNQKVEIIGIELKKFVPKKKIKIVTKSPITVYSTEIINGKRWINYFTPFDEEFYKLIVDNLVRKYKAFYNILPDEMVSIKHVGKNPKEQIIVYKNTVIKAWHSIFEMKGNKKLLELAFNSGIGSKNSIGFGCIDLI
ncbi:MULTISPECIES: CRISPR-associated endoribonuclease Cas6 [unclassified Thermosipho (in: thermotogales)]|uniref:CRISPR-associated endoribonuclease Cas6 n=1 Tax=unclassified Thermosipho (in: thermotogales) TaxID=2676525 RepID=UPI0009CAB0C6|nr:MULTISPECIES: CRISPR-associated endoribonuclease Cas6 [unclassified Thermosipho (in: thermotogales)]MBT1248357.1 hypothetical protein [Thermosipho sp. 1244]OOC47486.1 hypothetical protein XO09_00600 [Thermosipho sp. 1223]